MPRLTVTQIRVGVVCINLVVTLVVGAMPVYRYFSPHETADEARVKRLTSMDAKDFLAPPATAPSGSLNVALVAGVEQSLRKLEPPPPPPPPPDPTTDVAADIPPVGEDALPPGPLEEDWVYDGGMYVGFNDDDNWGYVRRRDANPAGNSSVRVSSRSAAANRIRTTTLRGRTVTSAGQAGAPGQPATSKLLRPYDEWVVDEESGLTVWIDRITPDEIVYHEHGKWDRKYALRPERETIYKIGPEGATLTPPKPEADATPGATPGATAGATPAGDAAPAEEKKYFELDVVEPTQREIYDARKSRSGAAAPRPRPAGPAAAPTAPSGGSAGTRQPLSPRPAAGGSRISPSGAQPVRRASPEDLKKLREETKSLPPDVQKKIEEGMREAADSSRN